MDTNNESKDTPEGMLHRIISINMAEQLKTQAMLETIIAVMFSEEQKASYNDKIKSVLKGRMIKHVESHPELSSDIQGLIDQIQSS